MNHTGGVSWTPFAAAAAAIPLLGAGATPWLAAPAAAAMLSLAAAVVARWANRRRAGPATAAEVDGLRRALVRRDEQLATTVHELRTPLASVITALDLLRSGRTMATDEGAVLVELATLSARHLAFIVDDVLDRQALATGTLRLSLGSHGVDELLAESLRALELQAAQRGVAVRAAAVDPALAVRTDPRRFLQVMFNLVGNAMKFTARGDLVEVRAEAAPNRVRFAIVDHGPGVPDELRDRLFSPLGSDDGGTAGASGNGLGLFVCARLVQQMGGRIGHERPADGGSSFWFELPRAAARASNSEIAVAAGAAR